MIKLSIVPRLLDAFVTLLRLIFNLIQCHCYACEGNSRHRVCLIITWNITYVLRWRRIITWNITYVLRWRRIITWNITYVSRWSRIITWNITYVLRWRRIITWNITYVSRWSRIITWNITYVLRWRRILMLMRCEILGSQREFSRNYNNFY